MRETRESLKPAKPAQRQRQREREAAVWGDSPPLFSGVLACEAEQSGFGRLDSPCSASFVTDLPVPLGNVVYCHWLGPSPPVSTNR